MCGLGPVAEKQNSRAHRQRNPVLRKRLRWAYPSEGRGCGKKAGKNENETVALFTKEGTAVRGRARWIGYFIGDSGFTSVQLDGRRSPEFRSTKANGRLKAHPLSRAPPEQGRWPVALPARRRRIGRRKNGANLDRLVWITRDLSGGSDFCRDAPSLMSLVDYSGNVFARGDFRAPRFVSPWRTTSHRQWLEPRHLSLPLHRKSTNAPAGNRTQI